MQHCIGFAIGPFYIVHFLSTIWKRSTHLVKNVCASFTEAVVRLPPAGNHSNFSLKIRCLASIFIHNLLYLLSSSSLTPYLSHRSPFQTLPWKLKMLRMLNVTRFPNFKRPTRLTSPSLEIRCFIFRIITMRDFHPPPPSSPLFYIPSFLFHSSIRLPFLWTNSFLKIPKGILQELPQSLPHQLSNFWTFVNQSG